jgi:phenylalanine-4-hydroxylase
MKVMKSVKTWRNGRPLALAISGVIPWMAIEPGLISKSSGYIIASKVAISLPREEKRAAERDTARHVSY